MSREPKTRDKGSTYFGVAMLPSKTASQFWPIASQRMRASRSRGMRYRGLLASTGADEMSIKFCRVTIVSGDNKPCEAVITTTPGMLGGGFALERAYASFPRK